MWTLPPFWLFFYQNSRPPQIQVKFKQTPQNWLSFLYTPPKICEEGLHPSNEKIYNLSLNVFDTLPNGLVVKRTVSPQENFWYVLGGPPLIPKTRMKIPQKNCYPQKINFSKNSCASWSQNWLPGTNLGAKIGYSGTNLGAKIGYPEQT